MLKFILLGISIVAIMLFIDTLLPKVKLKYRLYKEEKESEKRKRAFRNKMKELEIK